MLKIEERVVDGILCEFGGIDDEVVFWNWGNNFYLVVWLFC